MILLSIVIADALLPLLVNCYTLAWVEKVRLRSRSGRVRNIDADRGNLHYALVTPTLIVDYVPSWSWFGWRRRVRIRSG